MSPPPHSPTNRQGADQRDRAWAGKGRQLDPAAVREVQALLGQAPLRRDLLIEYLHALQDRYHGLQPRHLAALAAALRVSMAEVYEVASFYHHFDLLEDGQRPASPTLRICDGLSCQLAGSAALLESLQQRLGGRDVRVVSAPCIGRCEQAPAVLLDQRAVAAATVAAVMDLLDRGTVQAPLADSRADFSPADWAQQALTDSGCAGQAPAYVGFDAYRAQGGYALIEQVASGQRSHASVIEALEQAGLRGLGGAGFPAARKWRIVAQQPAPRLLVVNIDEGEPGTFKDRTFLERDPHRLLEGALLAALVVGADAIYLYLRDEYHACRALLSAELQHLRAQPPCTLPPIELRRGAGAYICGEESALIESLQGKRGQPRLRPPYIAEVGLFGRPTLEHNFETLYWLRDVVERGAAWFAGFGRNGRHGLRSFSVSGRVRSPGVKLAPAGITLRELIDAYCGGMAEGHRLYAYLPGGASGGILPERLADEPLDFDTLQQHGCFIGSAAIVVLSQADRACDAALAAMRFFSNESCGQCTPCRVGTAKAAQLMRAPVWDVDVLADLAEVMDSASICGLGQAAANPLRSVLRHFAHEIDGTAQPQTGVQS